MKTVTMMFQLSLSLLMSIGVTAGSMYVTVSASVGNTSRLNQELQIESTSSDEMQSSDESALRAVSVVLNSDGSLTGRISSIDPASGELEPTGDTEVTLVTRNGRELTTTSRNDGTFIFGSLSPGAYTINATGTEGRLSYGMRVVRNHNAVTDEIIAPVPVSMELQLDAALAPSRDMQQLNRLLRGIEVDPAEPGGEFNESSGGDGDIGDDDALDRPGQQLYLDDDGAFRGQLTLMDPGTGNIVSVRDLGVRFLESDQVVASTRVNSDGSFTQDDLEPGVYTMLIAGSDGIAYMGVEVVSGREATATQYQPTGGRIVQQLSFGMVQGAGASAGGGGDGDGAVDGTIPPPPPGAPVGGGTGGGGFGGGGEGGLSGLGPILPLAAIGLAAAALADDNNVRVAASPSN